MVGGGQELAGSLAATLSWTPASSTSLAAIYGLGLYWGDVRTYARLKVEDSAVSELQFSLRWYRRPYRLSGKATFAGAALDKAELEARYWEPPWTFRLRGVFSADEPLSLELRGSYEGEEIEASCYLAFRDPSSFAAYEGALGLPLPADWELTLRLKGEGVPPGLYAELKGPTPWGRADLRFRDLSPVYLELYREWTWGGWDNELTLSLDVAPWKLTLEERSTRRWSEDGGWGARWRIGQAAEFGLERLDVFLFDRDWKLVIRALSREVRFKARHVVGEEAYLNVDAGLYPEGWEAEVWLEGALGEVEWTLGCYLYDGRVDELYAEIYLEF